MLKLLNQTFNEKKNICGALMYQIRYFFNIFDKFAYHIRFKTLILPIIPGYDLVKVNLVQQNKNGFAFPCPK